MKKMMMSTNELKYFDGSATATDALVAWTFKSALVGIAQGNTNITRVGNKIFLKQIQFMFMIHGNGTALEPDGNQVRVIVYHNKSALGAVPDAASVFHNDTIHTMRNTELQPRFAVLKDFMHTIMVTGIKSTDVFTSGPRKCIRVNIYPNKVVDFTGTGSTIAAIWKDDYGYAFSGTNSSDAGITVRWKVLWTDA